MRPRARRSQGQHTPEQLELFATDAAPPGAAEPEQDTGAAQAVTLNEEPPDLAAPLADESDTGTIAATELSDEARGLLALLETLPGWVCKAELPGRAIVDDATWLRAINELLAKGAIEQRGTRRGARYRRTQSSRS